MIALNPRNSVLLSDWRSYHWAHFLDSKRAQLVETPGDVALGLGLIPTHFSFISSPQHLRAYTQSIVFLLGRGALVPTEETFTTLFGGVEYQKLPIAHVHSSYQNTIITITDHTGKKCYTRYSTVSIVELL